MGVGRIIFYISVFEGSDSSSVFLKKVKEVASHAGVPTGASGKRTPKSSESDGAPACPFLPSGMHALEHEGGLVMARPQLCCSVDSTVATHAHGAGPGRSAGRAADGDPRAWPCASKLAAMRSTPRSATGAVWARSRCRGPCAMPGAPAEKGLLPGVAAGAVVFIS